jgi:hypothetical protein
MRQKIVASLKKYVTRKNAASVARAALAFVGGCIVAYSIATGRMDADQARLILAWLTQVSGIDIPTVLVTTVGPIVWAAWKNRREDAVLDAALNLPAGSSKADVQRRLRSGPDGAP